VVVSLRRDGVLKEEGEADYCNNEGRKSKVRAEKGNEKEVKGYREGIC
jgi:hypothetical protein